MNRWISTDDYFPPKDESPERAAARRAFEERVAHTDYSFSVLFGVDEVRALLAKIARRLFRRSKEAL